MVPDELWLEADAEIDNLKNMAADLKIITHKDFLRCGGEGLTSDPDIDAILVHKGFMFRIDLEELRRYSDWYVYFANEVFVLYLRHKVVAALDFQKHSWDRIQRNRLHSRPIENYLEDIDKARFSSVDQAVFIHIPKTAGTSIFNAVSQKKHRSLYLARRQQIEVHTPHFPAYDFIAGHFPYHLVKDAMPGAKYLSIVREPFERLISAVGHSRRADENVESFTPRMRAMRSTRLSDFLQTPDGVNEMFAPHFMLTGERRPDRDQIEASFDKISVSSVERLGEFLQEKRDILPVSAKELPRLNVTSNRGQLIPQSEIDEAYTMHRDLVEEARELYRLLQIHQDARMKRPLRWLRKDTFGMGLLSSRSRWH